MSGVRVRTMTAAAWIVAATAAAAAGATPAAPSYSGVQETIRTVRETWKANPSATVNTAAWDEYFTAVERQLQAYGTADSESKRLAALDRLYRMSAALAGVRGTPSDELRAALDAWLRPRTSLAWAVRRLEDTVRGLPATEDQAVRRNRESWNQFVADELGDALKRYEGAASTTQRLDALADLRAALATLQKSNTERPWAPSSTLQSALAGLFDRPNVEASADVAALSRYMAHHPVQDGPVYRDGQVAMVTAGPYTGFGLMTLDGGIAFYNKQMFSTYTAIRGFHQQMAADPQGRRATKMYNFSAASQDRGETTAIAVLYPWGLDLDAQSTHNVSATVCSTPAAGGGLQRLIASAIGMNQSAIVQRVHQGAIGQIREGVHRGARAEAAERLARAEAEQNAQLARFLIGDNSAAVGDFLITGLDLHSRPQYAWMSGTLKWRTDDQRWVGADRPKPSKFAASEPGVTADVHLTSVLTNLARGYYQTSAVQDVSNVMLATRPAPAGDPEKTAAFETQRNVDDAAYLAAVTAAQEAGGAGHAALRLHRPSAPPRFAADDQGNLVAVIDDLRLDISAPPEAARGGLAGPPARYYRLEAPHAEFAVSFALEPSADGPPRLTGRVVSFDPGPGTTIAAVLDDPAQPARLNAITSAVIVGVLRSRVQGRPLDVPLNRADLPGYQLRNVSPLDPSGWLRVVLNPR